MRNLTIKRNKTFVACLAKMKVYIEDASANDLTINGLPCRKLGDLKNGEEKTFSIGENAAKVFVIAGASSKNFCNEIYNLPEGAEDISLTGQCRYNPASGNAFRFDGVTDHEVLRNRDKGTNKGVIVLIIAAVVGAIIGFAFSGFFSGPDAKTFTAEDISITLTDEFKVYTTEDFDAAYESDHTLVILQEDKFYWIEGSEDYTTKQYAELFIEFNELDVPEGIETIDGIDCFVYEEDVDGEVYSYFAFVYKTDDAFWTVQFATPATNYQKLRSNYIKWAKTVKFSEK